MLLRDFFHSLAIISALFLASLFAISFLRKALNLDLGGLKVPRKMKAGQKYVVVGYRTRVRPWAFYNNSSTSTTSRILGKWAVFSAVAAFQFSRATAVNLVAVF